MYTVMFLFYVIFSLFCPSVSLSAATEPDDSQLALSGVIVGRDTLKTVQDKFGPSKPCVVSEHVTKLGYIVGNETVLFESSDIGGGDITGFVLRLSEAQPKCNLSSPRTGIADLRTDGGVHLGMTRDEFTRIFGSPKNKSKNGTWVYQWAHTADLTKAQQKAAAQSFPGAGASGSVDILTTVEARFSTAGLTYFYISRIKSL
jgi:hypothetical protein